MENKYRWNIGANAMKQLETLQHLHGNCMFKWNVSNVSTKILKQ